MGVDEVGRVEHARTTGASVSVLATELIRSRKVRSAQWMSSISTINGSPRAMISKNRRAAQNVSSTG